MTSGTSLDRAPRIVAAGDDPELRLLVVDVLTDAGFEVLEAIAPMPRFAFSAAGMEASRRS